jgi:hypothetical protein
MTTPPQEDSRRAQKSAPSEKKAQELRARLHGELEAHRGAELVSPWGRVSTERV